uniref:Arb2 domain-containing protein n=1 Tax=Alexandrium catenella TaxID=2925 RepID=A0A7S1WF98_ALECA
MEELRALGYEYRGGRLLAVGKDEGFKFKDQAHYDALADAVLRYVTSLLESEAQLRPLWLPLGAESGPRCPIYVSEGFESATKVLLLIQGSGRVRVGVWGCALCINKDLDQGTMLPYLREAAARGYGVMVLNPNMNEVDGEPIPGSEAPDRHVEYVWQNIVASRCGGAATIDVIAHSNGGRALLYFLAECKDGETAAKRINQLVFTDSYHQGGQAASLGPEGQALLRERCVNYVPHEAPFGTPVKEWVSLGNAFTQDSKGCPCVSAQTPDHAATNQASLKAAFDFIAK